MVGEFDLPLAEPRDGDRVPVERGLYRPSGQILKSIADALKLSQESVFARAGLLDEDEQTRTAADVEEAIRLDERLTPEQKETLIRVYRGFQQP